MGMCIHFANTTDKLAVDCGPVGTEIDIAKRPSSAKDPESHWIVNCTFKTPGLDTEAPPKYSHTFNWTFRNASQYSSSRTVEDPQYMMTDVTPFDHAGSLLGLDLNQTLSLLAVTMMTGLRPANESPGPPEVYLYHTVFYLCSQTYHGLVATQNRLSATLLETEPLDYLTDLDNMDLDNPMMYLEAPSTGARFSIDLQTWYSILTWSSATG